MEKSRFRRDNPRCSHFLSPNSKFIVYIFFDIFDDLTHDLLCFEFFPNLTLFQGIQQPQLSDLIGALRVP